MPVNGFSKTAVRDYAAAKSIKYTTALRAFETRPGADDDLSILAWLSTKARQQTKIGELARICLADPEFPAERDLSGFSRYRLDLGDAAPSFEYHELSSRYQRWFDNAGGMQGVIQQHFQHFMQRYAGAADAVAADAGLRLCRDVETATHYIAANHPQAVEWWTCFQVAREWWDWRWNIGGIWFTSRDVPGLDGYARYSDEYGLVPFLRTLPDIGDSAASQTERGYAVYVGEVIPGLGGSTRPTERNWEFVTARPADVADDLIFEAVLHTDLSDDGREDKPDLFVRYPERWREQDAREARAKQRWYESNGLAEHGILIPDDLIPETWRNFLDEE